MNISVLGTGAWGTALATMLASQGTPVCLWGRSQSVVDEINQTKKNANYLSDVTLSQHIQATTQLSKACDADTVLYVLPAQSFREFSGDLKAHLKADVSLVLCAKGIDQQSGELLHAVAAKTLGAEKVAALSGPSFAHDVARGLPTAVSLAAHSMETAKRLAVVLSRPKFRIYASDDLVGVEAGGALKNVLALAVGIARGLGLGASAEAALIARGFAELNRLSLSLGARPETLSGLSGLGDLVLTCSSPQSRNFSYGMALARGENLENRPLAEGVHSAAMAVKLAKDNGVEAPILDIVNRVLDRRIRPEEAVSLLLSRPLRDEH